MDEVFTDCRTDEGVTIGLLDSIIYISRILVKRNLKSKNAESALRDFRNDEDVKTIMGIEKDWKQLCEETIEMAKKLEVNSLCCFWCHSQEDLYVKSDTGTVHCNNCKTYLGKVLNKWKEPCKRLHKVQINVGK